MREKNCLVISKTTWRIWQILPWWKFAKFLMSFLKSQVSFFYRLLTSKVYKVWAKKLQRSCVSWHWTMVQNLANLANFHTSTQKSQYWHFDRLLLSKVYNALFKKLQGIYVSQHWRMMQTLKRNLLVISKMTRGLYSLFYLMCAIAHAHASTCVCLMCVKNSRGHFYVWHLLFGMLSMKKMKERSKSSNWIVDHLSLTFVTYH